jgi:hypothetical protein
MPQQLSARYRDAAGVEHRMRLERSTAGRWRVLDESPAGVRLVEELTGYEDRRPQAEALARDYARQAALPACGRADEDDDDAAWAA